MHATPSPLSSAPAPSPARAWAALAAWALVALALAFSGVLTRPLLTVPPPALIFTLVAAGLLVHARWAPARAWAREVDLRLPILFHACRILFGATFLVLASRGELTPAFVKVGWGDLTTGVLAVLTALLAARPGRVKRGAVLAWNTLGLLDMGMTMATALGVFLSPQRMELAIIATTPLSILGVFVVPLVFLTHFLVYARLLRG